MSTLSTPNEPRPGAPLPAQRLLGVGPQPADAIPGETPVSTIDPTIGKPLSSFFAGRVSLAAPEDIQPELPPPPEPAP